MRCTALDATGRCCLVEAFETRGVGASVGPRIERGIGIDWIEKIGIVATIQEARFVAEEKARPSAVSDAWREWRLWLEFDRQNRGSRVVSTDMAVA